MRFLTPTFAAVACVALLLSPAGAQQPQTSVDVRFYNLSPAQQQQVALLEQLYDRELQIINEMAQTQPERAQHRYQLLQWQTERLLYQVLNPYTRDQVPR